MNPELRQTFNTISRNFESANEAAQVNFYDFTSHYIDPCIGSIKACIADCTAPCFPNTDDQLRRKRERLRARADFYFDFYDDWDEDENEATRSMGWENDELDSLLAGRGQPRPQRAMSYGARGRRNDLENDPTIIPKSSYLGFLDRLPFKIGAKGLRYKPSSAGLQENPGGLRIRDVESDALLQGYENDRRNGAGKQKGHARTRSHTGASQSTTTSHSARSDLIMSDEDDDAVPLDDEFAAVMLSRRTTSSGGDEISGGKISTGKRPNLSRVSTRSASSKSLHVAKKRRSSSKQSLQQFSADPAERDRTVISATELDIKRQDLQTEQGQAELPVTKEATIKAIQDMSLSNGSIRDTEPPHVIKSNATTPDRTPSKQSLVLLSPASPLSVHDEEIEPFPDVLATPKTPEESKPP